MIESLKLKFGRAPGIPADAIPTTPVTVFVGPNYSGKSKVLQEIYRYVTQGQPNTADVILDSATFAKLPQDVAEEVVRSMELKLYPTETVVPGNVMVGKRGHRNNVPRERFINALMNPPNDLGALASWYLTPSTMILDGKSRIGLTQEQGAGDLQQPSSTSFQTLFRDNTRRAELRRIIYDAFGVHLVIDPTKLGTLRLRLSATAPVSEFVERGIHEDAVQFHSQALPIDQGSDGIKAFAGMMTEIIAGDPVILLIDEPEAFLHPALSSLLGNEIARATAKSRKRLFVSTHSAAFVMGCVQAGVPITLVRLTYRGGVATARVLASTDILKLMRHPLLRSTGVLNGLFYESVVVSESDADRAFYQEINERLLRDKPEAGIPNCLFINAQNKQTVPTILRPLRELGIPAAGIVDIDVLRDGGTVWASFIEGGFIPELEKQSLALMRSAAKNKFDATGKNMKRDGGITLLTGSDREAVENLFGRLAEYGLFVVQSGELESWLKNLGATGHGPQWLVTMFEKMSDDPDSGAYVRPAENDVWAFISSIKRWLANPNRKGIPS